MVDVSGDKGTFLIIYVSLHREVNPSEISGALYLIINMLLVRELRIYYWKSEWDTVNIVNIIKESSLGEFRFAERT